MKKLLLVLLALLVASFSTVAFAEDGATASEANIHQGNWFTDASVSYLRDKYSDYESTDQFSLFASAQYFLLDRFSLGLVGSLDARTRLDTTFSIGPKGSFFFWNDGKVASFVSVAFQFGLTQETYNTQFGAELGVLYFFTPSVAFGPSVFWRHFDFDTYDLQRLGGQAIFAIYL